MLGLLGEALFPSRGSCPSCGREALWIECLPAPAALCLRCRRLLAGLFKWEEEPVRGYIHGDLPQLRGRIVQCSAIPQGLASALSSGGTAMMAQAASAIASHIPLPAYFAIERIYADAGESFTAAGRLSPLARAFAYACEAEFIGVVSAQAVMFPPFTGHSGKTRGIRRPPGYVLVVMQGAPQQQAEEMLASKLSGSNRIICAYAGAVCQAGREAVV